MTIILSKLTKMWGTYQSRMGGTYLARYFLQGDDPKQSVPSILDDAATIVGDNDQIPTPEAVYTDDVSARARIFQVDQLADQGGYSCYDCTVTFMPNTNGYADTPYNQDPLQWEPVIWYEYDRALRGVPEGRNQQEFTGTVPPRAIDTLGTITNSADSLFEEIPTADVENRTLVARKNYATLAAVDAVSDAFELTWNNATFYGRPAKHARFLSIRADKPRQYFSSVYYPATIRIALDRAPQGLLRFDNAGLTQLVVDNGVKRRRILDDTKIPITDPWPLNLDGTAKAPGELMEQITYEYLTLADYSLLGIGT